MLTVQVEPPAVRGGRVRYRWQQDRANELQRRDTWFVHYHGVRLAAIDRRVLYDVLLSLQLPLWAAQDDRVKVTLREPVPEVTLEFWKAYFDAPHVEFEGPVDPTTAYDAAGTLRAARRGRRGRERSARDVAVTFGGGKDSTLAQQALLEQRDPRDVLLLHVVQLFHNRRLDQLRSAARSVRTVVGPHWRRHRGAVQLVTTDYMAVLRADRPGPRPHVNLHVAAMLPALLHHGVHRAVFSRTALTHRVVDDQPDGSWRFVSPSGRPERLQRLGLYYASVLEWPLHVECTHVALTELVSFGTLLEEYTEVFEQMVMCMRTLRNQRFCHRCPKCLEFAVFGLAMGHVASDMDYDALLLDPRVETLVQHARAVRGKTAWHGTGPYHPAVGTPTHFTAWCHALHLLDPDRPDLRVSEAARANLRTLREAWGRVPFPAVARLDARAVRASGPLGREVAEVAARVFPVLEPSGSGAEDVMLVGDRPAQFDYEAVMPTPLLDRWAERFGIGGTSWRPGVRAAPVGRQRDRSGHRRPGQETTGLETTGLGTTGPLARTASSVRASGLVAGRADRI